MYMKKKIFMLLALVMTVMTASAEAGFELTVGTSEHGKIAFTVDGQSVDYAQEGDKVEVTITPDDYFVVNEVEGQWYVSADVARARQRSMGLLNKVDLTSAGDNTWTFTMERANAEISATYLKMLTSPDITVSIGEAFYTGQAQKPAVTVKDGATELKEGTDYTVTYADNTLPGTAKVTITAVKGSDYTGERTETFSLQDGVIAVTADGYYGEYDGTAHGITVKAPEEATVRFGESADACTLSASPTYVNAGTYTVYYQVTRQYYATVTGSAVVYIAKAPATISYATKTVNKTFGDSEFTNELTMTGDGTVTFSTSDAEVATVDAQTGEVTITGAGTATITATAADGANYAYDPNSASYELTVGNATMEVTSAGWTGVYDGQPHSITVNAPEDARIKYGRSEDGCNLNRIPTYTNSGTYTCYYQVTMDNYTTVTGHETVTIKKAAGTISYAVTSIETSKGAEPFTNPLVNTGDGVVSYDTSDSRIARVNATTGEVIIGKKDGTATITATVKDGPNYDYAEHTATYDITVGATAKETAKVTFAEKSFTAKVGEDFAEPQVTLDPADLAVTYSSSDEKVATVDAKTGEVTLKAAGKTTITASFAGDDKYNAAWDAYELEVLPADGESGEVETLVINVDANEADGNNDEVDGVKFVVKVDKQSQSRQEERTFVDPVTGETVTKTVTIVPITLESIIIPKQEGASETDKQEIVVTVPPYVVGPDGTIYEITSIAADAFVSNEPTAVVTTVVLPDTEKPLKLEEGAMNTGNGDAMKVLTPLQHLDDYALNNALAKSYQALKVSAIVTPPNRYWTFSCGVDVQVPEGVSVYTCQVNNDKEVEIKQIAEEKLTVEGERIIMANNGVLVACTDGTGGNAYEIVANPGRQKSGSKIVTTDAKSYGQDNQLEPVIEKKNYAASDYYVLVENEFHPILFNNSQVSACKAVLKYTGGSANARMVITVNNSATGIDASLVNSEERTVNGDVYDLNGRQVQTPAKGGVYIINNKKVVIKK